MLINTVDTEGPSSRVNVTYAGFISYSRAVDGKLAPILQAALQRFAKPWYRLRALRVFRDDASLSANPGLWSSILTGLAASEFFILLASPESAYSKWVQQEIDYWIRNKPIENLLIALTDGEIIWDQSSGDFDWSRTTALPPSLQNVLAEEPRYTDLRWARDELHLSLHDGRFRDCIADIAAPLHHIAKDDLVGDDIRQHRRTTRIVRTAIAILTILVLLTTGAAGIAVQQRHTALAERSRAVLQRNLAVSRQLAAEADLLSTTDTQTAMLLSITAFKTSDTDEARTSLVKQLQNSQQINRFLPSAAGPVNRLAFSPDQRTLAATSAGAVELWNTADGIRTAVLPGALSSGAVFSPDGQTLAVAEGDPFKNGTVVLWDVARRTEVASLTEGIGITAPAFSADGRILATSGVDETSHAYPSGKIILWDVATRQQIATLLDDSWSGHIRFSPDGRILAVEQGSAIILWDIAQHAQMGTLTRGPGRGVNDLGFSPDGSMLATGGHDGKLILWDVRSLLPLAIWEGNGDVNAVAFSPDGRLLAAGDNGATIALWDVPRRTRLSTLAGGHISAVLSLIFSPDGKTLISAGNDNRLVVWNILPHNPLTLGTLVGAGSRPAFSPDGRTLATSKGNDILLWDVPRNTRQAALADAGTNPVFSPNGKLLVTTLGSSVVVWDIRRRLRLNIIHIAGTTSLDDPSPVFSPDGRIIAIVENGDVILWEIARSALVGRLNDDPAGVSGVAFSPDGRIIATGHTGYNGINLWDVAKRSRLSSIPSHSGDPVSSLSFNPDGTSLAWSALGSANTSLGGDFSVIVWDLTQGTNRKTFTVHTGLAHTVSFSSDGRMLAWDGDSVVLWSVNQGAKMAALIDPHGMSGHDVLIDPVFSPDGSVLATVNPDGDVVLWDVSAKSWSQHLCSIAGRDLSRQEWSSAIPDQPYQKTCS